MSGKRVGVIGTGASSVQFVPELAEQVERLVVFQRTANWFMPRKNRAYPRLVKAAIRYVPGVHAFRRRFMFDYSESLTLMIRNMASSSVFPDLISRIIVGKRWLSK